MSIRRRPLAAKQGVGGQSQAWGNTDLEHGTKDVKRRRWFKRAEVQEGGSEDLFMTPFDVVLPKEGANSLNGEINGNATQRTASAMRRMLHQPVSRWPWATVIPDLRQAQTMKPSFWPALRQELLDPFRSTLLLVWTGVQYTTRPGK